MKAKNQLRIFIVEDNEIYANSLSIFLQTRFPNIIEIKVFNTGEEFLNELHYEPDIVIMDYFLNTRNKEAANGLEIIKRIKAQKVQTKIILLSQQNKYSVPAIAISIYGCSYVQKGLEAFDQIEQLI